MAKPRRRPRFNATGSSTAGSWASRPQADHFSCGWRNVCSATASAPSTRASSSTSAGWTSSPRTSTIWCCAILRSTWPTGICTSGTSSGRTDATRSGNGPCASTTSAATTRPGVLTTGSSRITFARRPNLRRLFDEYAEQLLAAGYADWRPLPFRYNTDGEGRTLEGDRRRLFRAVVKEHEAAGAALPMPDLGPLSLATWANSDALERSASSAALAEYYLNRRPTLETQRLPRLVSAMR